ncbi:MAG: phosphate signaling complex protein PhoU [Dehalococcoidia bacterium]|nr:phosphate signaling complex protein PhoU [Dehalococcoidia bacterium]
MPRESLNHCLRGLQDEVLVLGSMVDKAIARSIKALQDRDLELARQVVANDANINQKRLDVEEKCIELIVTQQPVASDLRVIIAVLNIIIDLERIGDHAEGIAKITIMIGDEPPLKPLIDLPRMAEKARDMLRRSLDAFVGRDSEAAMKISAEDDEVDNLYDQVYRELLTFMLEDPRTITKATRLIWVAHNLERSADRATNICERVVFSVTGQMEEIGASKY